MIAGQKINPSDIDNYRYRKSRCGDCGFTQGTKANLSGLTAIKAALCADIPTPFLCHFNAEGNEVPDGKEVLCQGWVEACNELESIGHYEKQPDWLRDHKLAITDIISEIESMDFGGDESGPTRYFAYRMTEVMEKG